MFKLSLCRYSTRSQMALDIRLQKTNTGQKSLSFLAPKIWSKISSSIKNFRTSSSLCMLLRKIFYFICKTNSSYYHLLMVDIIVWFFQSNIISSCHHWYPFKSFVIFKRKNFYTSGETLMEIRTFRSFFRLSLPSDI